MLANICTAHSNCTYFKYKDKKGTRIYIVNQHINPLFSTVNMYHNMRGLPKKIVVKHRLHQ